MITLYHGSGEPVPNPLAKVGRRNLDFGRGFYLTRILDQAVSWAKVVSSRKGRSVKPVVTVFQFADELARKEGVRLLKFDSYNLEWLEYVVGCRCGKDVSDNYDVVEGGVANDNVIDTVEDYEKGIITAEQALGQLQYKKVNHQLCILNQNVIDNYLKFEKTLLIDREEADDER